MLVPRLTLDLQLPVQVKLIWIPIVIHFCTFGKLPLYRNTYFPFHGRHPLKQLFNKGTPSLNNNSIIEGIDAETLQFVRVPTVTQTDCIDAYSENDISKSMICAGYPKGGKDACTNDSGGPLVCYNR